MDGFKKDWFRDWFGEDYLTVYSYRNDHDAEALIRLILKNIPFSRQSLLLDLGCGNGRYSFGLLPQVKKIIGLDLSAHLLHAAQKRKQQKRNKSWPVFIRGDMRSLPFQSVFDVVLSLFTSFGYFENDQQHQQVASGIADVMKPGGYLVLDYLNASYVRQNLEPSDQRDVDGMKVYEQRWISQDRVFKKITVNHPDEERVFYESVRLFSRDEMSGVLQNAGIDVLNIFGDYDGRPHSDASKRMIFFGRKNTAKMK